MRHVTGHSAAAERPYLLITLAFVGFLGCAALIAGTLAAQTVVPDYNWISDTINDLAAGEGEIVMDVSLYGFAAGLLAVSLASAHAHLGGKGWSTGVLSFALLAALVIIVGARNEYGDSDHDGVVIHIYLVYGLGLLFALAPACMASALGEYHGWARRILICLTGAWEILCPIFLLVPTGIDGLIERALGLIACGMIGTFSAVFFLRGKESTQRLFEA